MRSFLVIVAVVIAFLSVVYSAKIFTNKDGKSIMYSVSNDTMSWISAVRYCQHRGGFLAEILDEHEENAIHMFLNETDPEDDKYLWIGLTDLAHEGDWVWISSGKRADYTNWFDGEPNNLEDLEHFAQLYLGRYDRKWNDCKEGKLGLHALCQHIL